MYRKISNIKSDFINAHESCAVKHETSLLSHMNDFQMNSTI